MVKAVSGMSARQRLSARTVSGGHFAAVVVTFMMLFGGGTGTCAAGIDEGGASARAAYYELSIDPGNATKQVDLTSSAKTASYRFQVKNTGDSSLPYCDLQLLPWTFGDTWSYTFIPSAPFEVNSGETKSIQLAVLPAPDAEAKRYTFQLKGKGSGVVTNSITINLDILQYGDVEVKAPPPQDANPGETLEFVFELVNTGNGKDEFVILNVEASIVAITAHLKDGNNRTGEVGYKQSVNKTVVVVIPASVKTTEGSAGFQLALWARSEFNSSQDDVGWTLIRVSHVFNISMDLSMAEVSLLPGETAEVNVTVHNLGNGQDVISLNLSAGFNAFGWALGLDRTLFNLSVNASGTTMLRVKPPTEALAGGRTVTILARSSGPAAAPVELNVSLDITVLPVRGLYATQLEFSAPGPVRRGDAVRFGFSFTNVGNLDELVDLAFSGLALNWTLRTDSPGEFHMPAGTLRQVNFTIQVPSNRAEASSGAYRIKLQVANADRSAVLNFSFEIFIPYYYDWELTTEGPTTVRLMPGVNNIANFTLVFTSTGDDGDEIGLTISGYGNSWARLEESGFLLPPDGIRKLGLTVEAPAYAEVGRMYGLNVIAASHNRSDLVKWLNFTVEIVWVDLELVESSVNIEPEKAEAGTPVLISATVQNLGSVEERFIEVAFFGPWRNLIEKRIIDRLAPHNGSVVINANWTLVAGENEITVKVDPNATILEMDKKNNEESGMAIGYQSDLVIDMPPAFLSSGSPKAVVFEGSKLKIQVTVRNAGTYSHDLTCVTIRLTDRTTGEVQTATISSLKARENATLSFNWTAHRTGEHTFTANVNPDGVIREKTLENNVISGTLRVTVPLDGDPFPPWVYLPLMMAVIIVILAVWMIKRI